MREGLKRGPLVEEDMFALPVVAAGDCHIVYVLMDVVYTGSSAAGQTQNRGDCRELLLDQFCLKDYGETELSSKDRPLSPGEGPGKVRGRSR